MSLCQPSEKKTVKKEIQMKKERISQSLKYSNLLELIQNR